MLCGFAVLLFLRRDTFFKELHRTRIHTKGSLLNGCSRTDAIEIRPSYNSFASVLIYLSGTSPFVAV
jgi:hypothetical protein